MTNGKPEHIHHSKSTKDILSADKVLEAAGLKKGDIFLDAGCGDGFISISASSIVGEDGKVYAIDSYPESIEFVKKSAQEKGIKNLEAIIADLTCELPITDDSVDLCVMANVLHGFVENNELNSVVPLIMNVLKDEGVFAVVEFKKVEGMPGPPFDVRLNPHDVEDILIRYGFEVIGVVEVGEYHNLVKASKNTSS